MIVLQNVMLSDTSSGKFLSTYTKFCCIGFFTHLSFQCAYLLQQFVTTCPHIPTICNKLLEWSGTHYESNYCARVSFVCVCQLLFGCTDLVPNLLITSIAAAALPISLPICFLGVKIQYQIFSLLLPLQLPLYP